MTWFIILTVIIPLSIVLIWMAISTMRHPKIPGPKFLKYTNGHAWIVDTLLALTRGERIANSLRKKYGPVVQVARNRVLVDSSDGIREVYAVSHRLNRPFPLVMFHNYGSENLVSVEDGQIHHDRRKPIRSIYSVSAVNNDETQEVMRQAVQRCIHHLRSFAEPANIRTPIRLLLYEIMSTITYGREHNLKLLDDPSMQVEIDKDIKYQDDRLFSLSGVIMAFLPRTVLWLRRKNLAPILMSGQFPPGLLTDRLGREALDTLMEQSKQMPGSSTLNDSSTALIRRMYAYYHANGPDQSVPSTDYILSDCADHFWAGVSTTTDALEPLIHHLSQPKNKDRQLRLRKELHDAGIVPGATVPSTEDLAQLPYLEAVIRETLRFNPPAPVALDRKVTNREGAISVCGNQIPPGTTIGASPFLVGRNSDVFDRPDEWVPERWLLHGEETETAGTSEQLDSGSGDVKERKEKLKEMKRHIFAFGAGPRMCLGINVAWAAMRAIVAGLYGEFETELVEVTVKKGWLWDSKKERVRLRATK